MGTGAKVLLSLKSQSNSWAAVGVAGDQCKRSASREDAYSCSQVLASSALHAAVMKPTGSSPSSSLQCPNLQHKQQQQLRLTNATLQAQQQQESSDCSSKHHSPQLLGVLSLADVVPKVEARTPDTSDIIGRQPDQHLQADKRSDCRTALVGGVCEETRTMLCRYATTHLIKNLPV